MALHMDDCMKPGTRRHEGPRGGTGRLPVARHRLAQARERNEAITALTLTEWLLSGRSADATCMASP
jgi:hypothetical protein